MSREHAIWLRLVKMSWDELRTRSSQEILKRVDALRYYLGVSHDGRRLRVFPVPAGSGRFFFDPGDAPQLAALSSELFPAETAQTIAQADGICHHRFDLLGFQGLDFGENIDWHLDPVHGKRAPRKPWFKVRYLNFKEVGDHKLIWELNRHQHLVTLAKAYCLTGKDRYAQEVGDQWLKWRRDNPYPIGINWASSLEVAFRSLAWIWVQNLLAECQTLPEGFQNQMAQAQGLNGRHIEKYLSTYFSPNTHLLGEGVALFFIGTLYPELPSARRWKQLGWEIVLREAYRQVWPDGMHFEQSLYYHVYALDFFLFARTLAVRNGITVPNSFDRVLEKMLDILCALSEGGAPPSFGDSDGGRVFDPRRNGSRNLSDPLSTGAVIFGRGDFKTAAGGLREETLWLLGKEAVGRFEEMVPTGPTMVSKRFESSGIHIMTSSGEQPCRLVIDAGPQGVGTAGHSHADALSLHMTLRGQEWLVDSGTLSYISPGNEREVFRATASHNTLVIDGRSQAEPLGPFAWSSLPDIGVSLWETGRTFDLFSGSHNGYARLPQPAFHHRWVFNLKGQFCLVRDLALGEGIHQLDLFWHLAPGSLQYNAESGAYIVRGGDQQGLAILPATGQGWMPELTEGRVSPVYGKAERGYRLRFSKRAQLPAEAATLLLPVGEKNEVLGAFEKVKEGARGHAVRAYCYAMPDVCHHVFFAERGTSWEWGPWASDAQFLYFGSGTDGRSHWILCGGSFLELAGQRVVTFTRPVGHFESVVEGGEREFFCSEEKALSFLSREALAAGTNDSLILGSETVRRGVN